VRRLVPQWAARLYCAALRHRQRSYSALHGGVAVQVSTCLCGGRQGARVSGANRKIRRAVGFKS
jgi:hypothetical protein